MQHLLESFINQGFVTEEELADIRQHNLYVVDSHKRVSKMLDETTRAYEEQVHGEDPHTQAMTLATFAEAIADLAKVRVLPQAYVDMEIAAFLSARTADTAQNSALTFNALNLGKLYENGFVSAPLEYVRTETTDES